MRNGEFLALIGMSQYEHVLEDDGVETVEVLGAYTLDMLTALGVKQGHAVLMLKRAALQ